MKIRTFFTYLLHNPKKLIVMILTRKRYFKSDETQVRLIYWIETGQKLHLNPPITYNEKLQWLKLYDRQPLYTTMVDKYAVKGYVSNLIGDQFVIPCYGVWDSVENIDIKNLPESFVLKVTHGGGNSGVSICKDKSKYDVDGELKRLSKMLKLDGYTGRAEWPYKNVPHRILAEAYMEDPEFGELRDYKFFCINGVPMIMFVASGRQDNEEPFFDFFDMDYKRLELQSSHPISTILPKKPLCFDKMKEIASILSKGIPQVRVDLYEVCGKVYFGEFTFFHLSGTGKFTPDYWNKIMGDWIVLPEVNR